MAESDFLAVKRAIPAPVKDFLKTKVLPRLRTDLRTTDEEKILGRKGFILETFSAAIRPIWGAFSVDDAMHFSTVLNMQRMYGIAGDILEIGTSFGRSAALIGMWVGPEERLHLCDAFDLPTEDSYRSKPTPEIVIGNVTRASAITPEQIVIHRCLSDDLALDPGRTFRFIHIDVGHSDDQVHKDLGLALRHSVHGTIIVVDDYDHPGWPGVKTGTDRFLHEHERLRVLVDLNRHGERGRKLYLFVGA
ncbi:MAG: class I SAM-dependent methyltransferase [Azospirillaceae bacterium]